MKKFIIRSLLFAALVFGVIGGLCALEISAEIRAYRRELVAPPGASLAVCSDSQLGDSVDPEVCPAFFNFSAHGRTLDQGLMVMGDLLRANSGRFRVVVVDVSPSAAVWPLDLPIDKMLFSGNYWLLHYLHFRENTRDMGAGFRVARDCLVGRRLRHFWRAVRGKVVFHSSLRGMFTPQEGVLKADEPEQYAGLLRTKAGEARGSGDIDFGSPVFVPLAKMAELAQEHGVELVLVTAPWSRDLIDLCGEAELDRCTAVVARWASARNVRYLNFLKEPFPDDCWYDGNHLNDKGARLFTPMLFDAVRKRDVPLDRAAAP